jgi:hypothetical protein
MQKLMAPALKPARFVVIGQLPGTEIYQHAVVLTIFRLHIQQAIRGFRAQRPFIRVTLPTARCVRLIARAKCTPAARLSTQ